MWFGVRWYGSVVSFASVGTMAKLLVQDPCPASVVEKHQLYDRTCGAFATMRELDAAELPRNRRAISY